MRHTFGSGEWIDVLPLGALRAKHKDAVEAAIKLHVAFDSQGNPDLSNMPLTMTIPKAQTHVLMSMCLTGWSFTTGTFDLVTGELIEGTEAAIPVPEWQADGAQGLIINEESFGELGIDDANDLDDYFAPYMEKVRRRPDPKGTTTVSSNGTSKARASHSRQD